MDVGNVVVLLVVTLGALLAGRAFRWQAEWPRPARRLAVICHRCGQAEQVEAFTDETVGTWGEKILCSACKSAQAPTHDSESHA